ncbi:hypothetical protein JCM11641_007303 [Rhodosporidiobolus odoratus]
MHFSSALPLAGLVLLSTASVASAAKGQHCHRRSQPSDAAAAHKHKHSKTKPATTHHYTVSSTESSTSSATSSGTSSGTSSATSSASSSGSTSSHKLLKEYSGSTFFDGFRFANISDPTHGAVSYVNTDDAWSTGLVSITSDNTAIMSIDRKSKLDYNVRRPSVRLESKDTYNSGLFIADFSHVPVGCSAWPAYWFSGARWPNQGEIDVFEQVNLAARNRMTLHTSEGCTRDTSSSMTGSGEYSSTDCYAYGSSSGCGVDDTKPNSYGHAFNEAGGGVFALSYSDDGIYIWRWNRDDIPSDVNDGTPDPKGWGTPAAAWGPATCASGKYFEDLIMTFDITTCGDWAGVDSIWQDPTQSGSCGKTYSNCLAAVQDPSAFDEAYFEINYVKVFSV